MIDPLDEPKRMQLIKNVYLFRKLVKNAKYNGDQNRISPLSHSPDRKICPFKKGFELRVFKNLNNEETFFNNEEEMDRK